MTNVEADILSTPAILRQVVERVGASRIGLDGPTVFLGCGSSNCVGIAIARDGRMWRSAELGRRPNC